MTYTLFSLFLFRVANNQVSFLAVVKVVTEGKKVFPTWLLRHLNIFLHSLDLCADFKFPCILIAFKWVSSSLSEVGSYSGLLKSGWSGTCLFTTSSSFLCEGESSNLQGNIVSFVRSQQVTALEKLRDFAKSMKLPWRAERRACARKEMRDFVFHLLIVPLCLLDLLDKKVSALPGLIILKEVKHQKKGL